jgi:sugar phosphate isomerase/epimerase
MTNWPVALSTGCFYHQSILDCLPLIRESGFSMIEVCSSPEHLDFHNLEAVRRAEARIQELGMEAYSFHAPFAPQIDIASSDLAQRQSSIAEILTAAEAAAAMRVHYFVLHPGPENPAPTPVEEQLPHMHNVIDSINQIALHCKDLGIMCALENKLPHLLFGNTSDLLWILDGVSTAEVGICLDTGHAALAGDMHNLVHKLSTHLRIIHAHDNGGTDDKHLPPGDGKIDWKKLLRDLIGIRFHGALILEMAGNKDPAVTMTNARRGRAYLRRIARSLALEAS